MRTWRAITVALTALALVAPTALAAEPQTNLADVEDEVMCPICGTVLELSESPQAQRERTFIREQIDQGQSKEQIKDALVAEYGEEVLAIPGNSGFDLAAWIVPGAAIVIAAFAIAIGLRRWRRSTDEDAANEPPPEQLSEEDDARLVADLSKYDL